MSLTRVTKLMLAFLAAIVLLLPHSVCGESTTAFGRQGPHAVSVSEVEGQGILFVPQASDGDRGKKQWPGIVFGHGLCGPARSYSESLERICSWGFVVIAATFGGGLQRAR